MHKPIYSSEEHKSTIEVYTTMCKQFVQDTTTQSRYSNYLEVIDIIVEYSNAYGQGNRETGNFYDWIMILPINISVATNGFFAGVETKSNAAAVRAYRVVLDQMLQETVNRLDSLDPTNE
jgi:hypothetical protein|tara:strand:- start:95 stop:454 length:360 start_codon:yes stop_codon:yes gene_type:complete